MSAPIVELPLPFTPLSPHACMSATTVTLHRTRACPTIMPWNPCLSPWRWQDEPRQLLNFFSDDVTMRDCRACAGHGLD